VSDEGGVLTAEEYVRMTSSKRGRTPSGHVGERMTMAPLPQMPALVLPTHPIPPRPVTAPTEYMVQTWPRAAQARLLGAGMPPPHPDMMLPSLPAMADRIASGQVMRIPSPPTQNYRTIVLNPFDLAL
jgi:hypothetical protein